MLTGFQESNWNITKKCIAIDGYDVVSYFASEVKKGVSDFKITYEGAVFYFSSESNLKIFEANPEKFIPQYGGYCACAMADSGDKVEVNPKTYKVTNGKLYLFYNSFGNNTLLPWQKDEVDLCKKADENWASKYLND